MSVDEILKERGSVYGSYKSGVDSRGIILKALKDQYLIINEIIMPESQEVWLMDLINKLARLSSNPNHLDSIHDLIGYAKLIESMIQEEVCQKKK